MIEVKEGGHIHYGSGHGDSYGYGGNWAGMIFGIIVLFLLIAVITTVFNRRGHFLGGGDCCDTVTPKEVLNNLDGFRNAVADKFCGVEGAIKGVQSEIALRAKDCEISALKEKLSSVEKSDLLCGVKAIVDNACAKKS